MPGKHLAKGRGEILKSKRPNKVAESRDGLLCLWSKEGLRGGRKTKSMCQVNTLSKDEEKF